jgi:hypothetical protein
MKKWAVKQFGGDYKGYYFWQAPSTTFTLGTIFEKSKAPLSNRSIFFAPDNYFLSGWGPLSRTVQFNKAVVFGNPVDLATDTQAARAVEGTLGLKNLLLGLTGKKTSNVKTAIIAGKVQARKIRVEGLAELISTKLYFKHSLLNRLRGGNYAIIEGDIIVNNLVITVDSTNNTDITSKLDATVGNLGPVGTNFALSKTGSGLYKLTTSSPLVLATYTRTPKGNDPWVELAQRLKTGDLPYPKRAE